MVIKAQVNSAWLTAAKCSKICFFSLCCHGQQSRQCARPPDRSENKPRKFNNKTNFTRNLFVISFRYPKISEEQNRIYLRSLIDFLRRQSLPRNHSPEHELFLYIPLFFAFTTTADYAIVDRGSLWGVLLLKRQHKLLYLFSQLVII